MNEAENWLADLEAKAKVATPGEWDSQKFSLTANGKRIAFLDEYFQTDLDFIAAANPAAVLRLVGMVRWLAEAASGNNCEPGEWGKHE